jgi:hypothetical protein
MPDARLVMQTSASTRPSPRPCSRAVALVLTSASQIRSEAALLQLLPLRAPPQLRMMMTSTAKWLVVSRI